MIFLFSSFLYSVRLLFTLWKTIVKSIIAYRRRRKIDALKQLHEYSILEIQRLQDAQLKVEGMSQRNCLYRSFIALRHLEAIVKLLDHTSSIMYKGLYCHALSNAAFHIWKNFGAKKAPTPIKTAVVTKKKTEKPKWNQAKPQQVGKPRRIIAYQTFAGGHDNGLVSMVFKKITSTLFITIKSPPFS